MARPKYEPRYIGQSISCDSVVAHALETTLKEDKISCYEVREFVLSDKAKGWLVTAGRPQSFKTALYWLIERPEGSAVSSPLSTIKDQPWDFLKIDRVGDFESNGSLEAFITATGGAGMYFHYPIVLRLNTEGEWNVIFASDNSFFYGHTEVLLPDSDGNIRLAVTSVDESAPWAFSQCSLCPHPFKREVFSLSKGKLRLVSRSSVPYDLSVVSDFILSVDSFLETPRLDDAWTCLAKGAVMGGKQVDRATFLSVLKELRLTEIRGGCWRYKEEAAISITETQGKKVADLGENSLPGDAVHVVCPVGKDGEYGARYVIEVVREEDKFSIKSIAMEGMIDYEKELEQLKSR